MNNSVNKIIIVAALLVGAASFYLLNQKKSGDSPDTLSGKNQTSTNTPSPADQSKKEDTSTAGDKNIKGTSLQDRHGNTFTPTLLDASELAEFKNLSVEEKKSLLTLSSLMEEAVNSESTPEILAAKLDDLKLKPMVMKDANPYTGTMEVVRSKDSLPGTRYIHAQYFTNDDGTKVLQHMSFELRPGPDSFEAAKKLAYKQFKITGAPSKETADFISWKRDGRNIWIKKKSAEDLKNDPFNSYDPVKDVGTVSVTNEAEIH